jgi:hypothetical protein
MGDCDCELLLLLLLLLLLPMCVHVHLGSGVLLLPVHPGIQGPMDLFLLHVGIAIADQSRDHPG